MALRNLLRFQSANKYVCMSLNLLPCLHIRTFTFNNRENAIFTRPKIFGDMIIRNKYNKKSSSSKEDEDSDSDSETEMDDFDKKTLIKVQVTSLRADLLLKSGISIARNKIETAFYENRIRRNGKKLAKKSVSCSVGDEIDYIKNESPLNPDHVIISRIQVLSITAKENSIEVKLRRFKSLTVEKYADWKPLTETEQN